MALYLAQHGRAYSEVEDPERRLTPEGVAETERVARLLAASGVRLLEVVHSGRARARQTAEIFARFLGGSVREADGLGPNDDPSIWASRAGGLAGDVMLVGHLPHLSRLLSLLVVGDASREVLRFRYSGVVKLEAAGGRWEVVWYVTPEVAP
ncbi:MAG: phosphohistidine phosphatase SixA [Thermoproteus sp.]